MSPQVWFEPWRDLLPLEPGGSFRLVGTSTEPGAFEVVEEEDRVVVYAWPGSTVQVFQGETLVMKLGGVAGWMRASSLAQAREIPVSSHLWPEVSARLLCCTPTAHWREYVDWWNPILAEPLRVDDGMAIVDDAPGSGLEWNEEEVTRFAA